MGLVLFQRGESPFFSFQSQFLMFLVFWGVFFFIALAAREEPQDKFRCTPAEARLFLP